MYEILIGIIQNSIKGLETDLMVKKAAVRDAETELASSVAAVTAIQKEIDSQKEFMNVCAIRGGMVTSSQ